MNTDINTHGPDFDSELRYFTRCCAAFELGSQSGRIESVHVHLIHTPEARDRKIRHCVVEVELTDGHRIVARDVDRDIHVAIYRALEGAGAGCTRRFSNARADVIELPIHARSAANDGLPDRAA